MASLPDLDTTNIAFIGFWNFLDHSSETSLDPSEVLAHKNVESYEKYDNGVQGTMTAIGHGYRTVEFRVKADGWIMVWFKRSSENYYTNQNPEPSYADLISNYRAGSVDTFPTTTLTRSINALRSQLSNGGTATFNHGDCGHHSYEFPNANTWTMMAEGGRNYGYLSAGLSYSGSTTRHYHAVLGATNYSSANGDDVCKCGFEGVTLAQEDYNSDQSTGVVDVLADNLMPASNTVYRNDGRVYDHYGDSYVLARTVHLILSEA